MRAKAADGLLRAAFFFVLREVVSEPLESFSVAAALDHGAHENLKRTNTISELLALLSGAELVNAEGLQEKMQDFHVRFVLVE